jgi:hypothetical protein
MASPGGTREGSETIDRMELARELRDNEFYEDFAYVPRRMGLTAPRRDVTGPIEQLEAAMDMRRVRNKQRKINMQKAKEYDAIMQPEVHD